MLIRVYLVIYFLLLAAAALVLWQSGVLARLPLDWVLGSVLVSIALGVLLALMARRRPTGA
jgi:hypothetical protein